MSLYARLAALLAVLVLLAGIAWKIDQNGYKRSQAEWTAEKLATSETARLREQAAQKTIERIDRDYQIQKARAAADKRITDDRLREFAAASGDTETSTTSGIDDPYRAIANQCADALTRLDEYAKGVAGKATALQGYTREVCLK
jgi:hypothetical protein